MSYIYTQNRSAYYSDSDESVGGPGECCQPCPPVGDTDRNQLATLWFRQWYPPYNNNPGPGIQLDFQLDGVSSLPGVSPDQNQNAKIVQPPGQPTDTIEQYGYNIGTKTFTFWVGLRPDQNDYTNDFTFDFLQALASPVDGSVEPNIIIQYFPTLVHEGTTIMKNAARVDIKLPPDFATDDVLDTWSMTAVYKLAFKNRTVPQCDPISYDMRFTENFRNICPPEVQLGAEVLKLFIPPPNNEPTADGNELLFTIAGSNDTIPYPIPPDWYDNVLEPNELSVNDIVWGPNTTWGIDKTSSPPVLNAYYGIAPSNALPPNFNFKGNLVANIQFLILRADDTPETSSTQVSVALNPNVLSWNGDVVLNEHYKIEQALPRDLAPNERIQIQIDTAFAVGRTDPPKENCQNRTTNTRFTLQFEDQTDVPISWYTKVGVDEHNDRNFTRKWDPQATISECEAQLFGGTYFENLDYNWFQWDTLWKFNDEYWLQQFEAGVPASIRLTSSLVDNPLIGDFNDAIDLGLAQGANFIQTVNTPGTGPVTFVISGNNWPTITIPYSVYSGEIDDNLPPVPRNPPNFTQTSLRWNWPYTAGVPHAIKCQLQYDYLDAAGDVITTNFQRYLFKRNPQTQTRTDPMPDCHNDSAIYGVNPGLEVLELPGVTVRDYTHPWIPPISMDFVKYDNWKPDDNLNDFHKQNVISVCLMGTAVPVGANGFFIERGSDKNDMFVYCPMFGEPGSTNYTVRYNDQRYQRTDGSTIAGAPRTVTWSVCGDVSFVSQHNMNQFGSSTRNLYNDITTVNQLKGLFYIQLNWKNLPKKFNLPVDDPTQRYQFFRGGFRTRLPSNWYFKQMLPAQVCPSAVPTTGIDIVGLGDIRNVNWSQPGVTLPAAGFIWNVNIVLSDIAEGDGGRSIKLWLGRRMEITDPEDRTQWVTIPDLSQNNAVYNYITGGSGVMSCITLRHHFDPPTKTLQFQLRATGSATPSSASTWQGITYMAQM